MANARERRHFFRHPINVPIRLRIPHSRPSSSYVSESSEISLGGLSFVWPSRITKGETVEITIPVKEKRYEVKGRVAYSREHGSSGHFRIGVEFVDFPDAFRARLAEEVIQILEYQKTLARESGHEISEEEAARRWIGRFADHYPKIG